MHTAAAQKMSCSTKQIPSQTHHAYIAAAVHPSYLCLPAACLSGIGDGAGVGTAASSSSCGCGGGGGMLSVVKI